MGDFKKQFPASWENYGTGVDVSRDQFIKPIGKKAKGREIGSNYSFNKGNMDVNDPAVRKYICMVGKCSGVIDDKPKDE